MLGWDIFSDAGQLKVAKFSSSRFQFATFQVLERRRFELLNCELKLSTVQLFNFQLGGIYFSVLMICCTAERSGASGASFRNASKCCAALGSWRCR